MILALLLSKKPNSKELFWYCHAAHSDAQERPEDRYTAKCRLTTVSIFVSETKKVNTSCIYLGLNSLLEGPGSCLHMAEGPDQGPLQL